MIPLSEPDITEAEITEVVAVLRTSRLSLGPRMEEFEAAFTTYTAQPFAIAVSSGTAGLHLAIRALGIGPGDEVLVPSFTFIAAANAIRYEGATPVFLDIDPATLNLDPALIEAAITPRTRAILVVHTFGIPADTNPILDLARRYNLRIIEDACEALGATYYDRKIGTLGDVSVFAFYPNKQITTGEGGMVLTADPALAATIRALRNQGRFPGDNWHQHSLLGFNYRLSEINCALGCAQMRRLESILTQRDQVALAYDAALSPIPEIIRPPIALARCRLSWFVYVVRLAPHFTQAHRDAIAQTLIANGIACSRYFAPIHTQPAYRDLPLRHPLPITESISQRTLALPFFNRLTSQQIQQVAATLSQALKHCSSAPPPRE